MEDTPINWIILDFSMREIKRDKDGFYGLEKNILNCD
jgi:hypothetical protein